MINLSQINYYLFIYIFLEFLNYFLKLLLHSEEAISLDLPRSTIKSTQRISESVLSFFTSYSLIRTA